MRMALEVRSLSKNYGKVQALKNVSFKIGTGVYGLLGPNGAGKSTMIRIITGSMRASSGEVLYNGSRIRENEKAYPAPHPPAHPQALPSRVWPGNGLTGL